MRHLDCSPESARQLPALEDPGTLVHVDFTEDSAHEVLKHYLKDEAEELSKKPWGIIQVIIRVQMCPYYCTMQCCILP